MFSHTHSSHEAPTELWSRWQSQPPQMPGHGPSSGCGGGCLVQRPLSAVRGQLPYPTPVHSPGVLMEQAQKECQEECLQGQAETGH